MIRKVLPCIVLADLLAGCATPTDYPSLALRPAEHVENTLPPDYAEPRPPVPILPSADLSARLAELERQARAVHGEFVKATPAARRLAAAAGPTASDSWASAQVALADLDSLRSRVAIVLADLDSLWADATLEAGPREAIGNVRGNVEDLVAQEDTVLAQLRGSI